MPTMTRQQRDEAAAGFTLVELLMAMLVSSLIMIGVFAAFEMQNRTHNAQTQLVDMQQNIRAAMTVMSEDIRMAGHDPRGEVLKSEDPGIATAQLGRITFVRAEAEEEGATTKRILKKVITYRIHPGYDRGDESKNPDVPDGVVSAAEFGEARSAGLDPLPSLVRCEKTFPKDDSKDCGDDNCKNDSLARDGSDCSDEDWEEVARGVEGLEFVYLTSPDSDKAKLKAELWREKGEADDEARRNIRAVTISLLVRSEAEDRRIGPSGAMVPASQRLHGKNRNARTWSSAIEKNTQHRRRLLFTTVQMRNSNLIKP